METKYIKHHINLIAEQRIKDIKGFYTHVFSTFLILPFLIFINLKTVPHFEWYWYAIVAWCLGLVIHWINVFPFSNLELKKTWKERKIKEIIGDESSNNTLEEDQYLQEKYYLKAKKQAQEIKGFYIHLFVYIFSFPLIVYVNYTFVPSFQFFWFALGGMLIALFFHWLGVFGFDLLGLGEKWEQKKTQEIIKKYQ